MKFQQKMPRGILFLSKDEWLARTRYLNWTCAVSREQNMSIRNSFIPSSFDGVIAPVVRYHSRLI